MKTTYVEIDPSKILLKMGPCNWSSECQAEDAKRYSTVTMIRLDEFRKNPPICPACKKPLSVVERYFVEKTEER